MSLVSSPVCKACGAAMQHVPRWHCCGGDCQGQSMYWFCDTCDLCQQTKWPADGTYIYQWNDLWPTQEERHV